MKRFAMMVAAAVAAVAGAATLEGRVVKVADGDTITVLDAAKVQHKVRLDKIDAPEKKQAFGNAARKHLASFVADKSVKVDWSKKDRYGRVLGTVRGEGGEDLNLRMVKDGYAWHYKHYDQTPAYAEAEREARTAKRGLWQEKNPVPPWEFRRQNR